MSSPVWRRRRWKKKHRRHLPQVAASLGLQTSGLRGRALARRVRVEMERREQLTFRKLRFKDRTLRIGLSGILGARR